MSCSVVRSCSSWRVRSSHRRGGARPQAEAVRIEDGTIRLDGSLDERVWQSATPVQDFVQREPVEGAEATQRTEVRFAYDETALYVGARMYSDDPAQVQAPLGRRDTGAEQSEHILISLDTFLDRRTAYTFGVSAAGVRFDRFHATDEQGGANAGFNPVWEAHTRVDDLGWTAELWIPFSQLRFNALDELVWGLDVSRFSPRLQEEVYWILVPRTEQAWASRFGDLEGIEGIPPSRRVDLLPVAVASATMTPDPDPMDPFDDGQQLDQRLGLDLKMGLGPNLTLDATINPDFGQVEADPAEVNLSAFATRFPERRPFFTEGANLLTLDHGNVFYSRRIGRAPVGPASGDFVDYPQTSTILAAGKITGRLPGGTSLGVLGAVTRDEYARTWSVGDAEITKVRVAPRTYYGVAKVQQEIGDAGSTASALVGTVHRALGLNDPLASLLSRDALVYGGDTRVRFRGGEYEFRAALVSSYAAGDAAGIETIQRSSSHFKQRPDREVGMLDPTLTALSGYSLQVVFDRRGGRHWLFGMRTKVDSNDFETNDIANLNGADGFQPSTYVTYRETQPGRVLRNYAIRLDQDHDWNLGGNMQSGELKSSVNVTWANFWTSSASVARNLRTESGSLARGGPLIGGPSGWTAEFDVANRATSQNRWSVSATLAEDEMGEFERALESSVVFRPGPRWELSVTPSVVRRTDPRQYVAALAGGRPETFGTRYVFAHIDRSTLALQPRMAFTLVPDLNLDVYAEPFAASGRYFDYGELPAPASHDRLTYGTSGTTVALQPDGSRVVTDGATQFTLANRDFNVRSFNSNVVLRWEWRPGSTMYLVWQQSRDSRDPVGARAGPRDLFESLTEPGTNILLFKTSFWIPVG